MVSPTPSFGVLRRTLALTACALVAQAALLTGAEARKPGQPAPGQAVKQDGPERAQARAWKRDGDNGHRGQDSKRNAGGWWKREERSGDDDGRSRGRGAKGQTGRPLPEPKPPRPQQPSPAPAPQPSAPKPAPKPGKGSAKPGKGDGKDDTSAPLPERPDGDDKGDDESGDGRSRNLTGRQNESQAPQQAEPVQPTQPAETPQPATPAQPEAGAQPGRETTPRSEGGERQPTSGDRRAEARRRAARRVGAPGAAPDGPVIVAPVGPIGIAAPPAGEASPAGRARSREQERTPETRQRRPQSPTAVVERTVREIVRVVPDSVKAALAAMLALVVMLVVAYLTLRVRARRLERQRQELLHEVGLLQAALLPSVPDRIGTLFASVAYRPAEGPAAGGDFYDAFQLEGGRVGIVVGDVAGHGREALAQTTLIRYTLRVYLETGLEPRKALQLAAGALREDLGAGFATACVAVYDPGEGTLRYASAGHPPPLLLGPAEHEPVTAVSSPPIGIGTPTGLRQTTVAFGPDTLACFFTDGLSEARVGDELLGRERLAAMLGELGRRPSASRLLERIVEESEQAGDDMAACVIRPTIESFAGDLRIEELELDLGDPIEREARRFLSACGVGARATEASVAAMLAEAGRSGAAVLRVRLFGGVSEVSVVAPFGAATAPSSAS